MARLTYQQRKNLKKSQFVIAGKAPGGGSYPIPDAAHGRNALARVSQFGTAAEKKRVRAAVKKKFPSIAIKGKKPSQVIGGIKR